MNAKEKVKKLILYVECRKRAEGYDPGSVLHNKATALKRELILLGVDLELLNMDWHDLEMRIYTAVSSQLNI